MKTTPSASEIVTTHAPIVFEHVVFAYDGPRVLVDLSLTLEAGHVYGLLGRNGAGKTTLLQVAAGLLLPMYGTCRTLGVAVEHLDTPQLSQLGFVSQEPRFIEWMSLKQSLAFTRTLYPSWDRELEATLVRDLELDPSRRLADLSVGDRQKVALVQAVCHRPKLLLLDEPMSALDPIARNRVLDLIIELLRDNGSTIVISSHQLAEVEKIADWLVFMAKGRVIASAPFDEVLEGHAEWMLRAQSGALPTRFDEPFVLSQRINGPTARLCVRLAEADRERFAKQYGVEIDQRPMTLDELFPILTSPDVR